MVCSRASSCRNTPASAIPDRWAQRVPRSLRARSTAASTSMNVTARASCTSATTSAIWKRLSTGCGGQQASALRIARPASAFRASRRVSIPPAPAFRGRDRYPRPHRQHLEPEHEVHLPITREGESIATGSATIVCVARQPDKSMKAVPIPPEIVSRFAVRRAKHRR